MKTIDSANAIIPANLEIIDDPTILQQIPKGAAVILSRFTLFATQLSTYWRQRGFEVVIISIDGNAKSGMLSDGTYVLAVGDFEPKWMKVIRYGPLLYLSKLEVKLFASNPRTKQILDPYPYQAATRFIGFGMAVAHLVKQLEPSFVFAQQVVRFGFSAAVCQKNFPTIAMPYGQDVYQLGLSSPPMQKLTEWSLKRVDMICPASASAALHIVKKYGVAEDKVKAISWGVDKKLFYPADSQKQLELRTKYGIPVDALVVINARRFDLGWGSKTVAEVFLELARRSGRYHFIIIGGTFTESYKEMNDLKAQIESAGIRERFLIFEEGVPISDFSELLMISDIFTSLMLGSDMRSASILQALATGSAPVLTDWEEYRYMEQFGFQSLFVPMKDIDKSVDAVEYYRENPDKMTEVIEANLKYIAEFEDNDHQMEILLQTINDVIENRK